MVHGEMSVATAAMASFKVFSLSTLLGLGVGFGFYLFLKLFDDKRSEFFAFVVEAYAAYVLAEHFHISGILTLIVAVVTTKFFIDRDIDLHKQALALGDGKYSRQYRRNLLNRFVATTHERMEYIYEMAREFGYIAAVVIFFLLAEMVDFSTLLSYWKEIVMMFGITTLIRALSMAKFAFLGDKTEAIKPVGIRGWFILTFSGMKGALSIILVHMLPHDLPYRQLFESVTIGVVVLSIFVYGTILWFYFMFFDKSLEEKRN
jgi:CPA1 family monovalent cation:H+ antiporter